MKCATFEKGKGYRMIKKKHIAYIMACIVGAGTGLGIDQIVEQKRRAVTSRPIKECTDKASQDRPWYDTDGFGQDGFNREGFDRDGYDRQGFDAEGYDRSGRDKRGFDRDGFDPEGFDRYGRDSEGYNRSGFGIDGFNRDGVDRQGYRRDGYDSDGTDRAGNCREYYSGYISRLRERLDDAHAQLRDGGFRYALYDARVTLEEALRLLVQHARGDDISDDRLLTCLKICEQQGLIPDTEFLNRLHDVRRICNCNGHEVNAEENMTFNKVYFVIMQVRDLLDYTKKHLLPVQEGLR